MEQPTPRSFIPLQCFFQICHSWAQSNLQVICPAGVTLATSCTFLPNCKSEIAQGSLPDKRKKERDASYLLWIRVCIGLVTEQQPAVRSQHFNFWCCTLSHTRKAGGSEGETGQEHGPEKKNTFRNFHQIWENRERIAS